ncbi:hypothetical protein N7474_010543 [Penicillium riverlandense]|uniref:uncharacterized protein n=1 Tax=Penicillium riverlandense TaxID=1903569 RepID=UPI0025483722|nr:uncharacterized protein N7474_010543 [Penicillium riverlandense]KAJ5806951.1 hypothetical protein N7474_010543 [Penicillium riverlandense]
MHDEGHDAGSEDIILHPCVPGGPQALGDVQVGIVLGNLGELGPAMPGAPGYFAARLFVCLVCSWAPNYELAVTTTYLLYTHHVLPVLPTCRSFKSPSNPTSNHPLLTVASARNACGVNSQLDRLQQHLTCVAVIDDPSSQQIAHLQSLIHSLSITSKTQPLLSANRLADLISGAAVSRLRAESATEIVALHVWLVTAKAAVQASSLAMNELLNRTLQLHQEVSYWDEVLDSPWYSGLYTVQTLPLRLWKWTKELYSDQEIQDWRVQSVSTSIAARWARFYQVVRQSARTRPAFSLRINRLTPIRECRAQVQQKRDLLMSITDIHTSSLGLMMEGWRFLELNEISASQGPDGGSLKSWCDAVGRSVALTETLLQQVADPPDTQTFEKVVSAAIDQESHSAQVQWQQGGFPLQKPLHLIDRLVHVLRTQLPDHRASVSTFIGLHGRPSRLIRYWLPAFVAISSSGASVQFLASHRDQILHWIIDIGATVVDFGSNWVVDPIRKLVGTIRHDEKSEIAIMSKNSLVADRASLERMVVDFVLDRPDLSPGTPATEDTTAIVNAVKEGDLTPVLRAYERDLRSPFVGTIKGDLVRALLIQIQKTKVDVEIAISGIDSLLKSQELVFGFVGLTPGILVSYATLQWLAGVLGSRRGLRQGKRQDALRRGLRNITRVLSPSSQGVLSHKDAGRLMCEAESLLQAAESVLGGRQYHELRQDVQDLLDTSGGVEQQQRVVERMRWTYSPTT